MRAFKIMTVDYFATWIERDSDNRIMNTARNFIRRANTTAHSLSLGHPFLYQNYAAADQDVFPSYGRENYTRLKTRVISMILMVYQPNYSQDTSNFEKRWRMPMSSCRAWDRSRAENNPLNLTPTRVFQTQGTREINPNHRIPQSLANS
jgi:hypothetical protein